MVTRALVGGAAENETGFDSLSSDLMRDRPTLVLLGYKRLLYVLDLEIIVWTDFIIICNIVVLDKVYVLARREGSIIC